MYLFGVVTVNLRKFSVVVAEGAECCKAYTGLDLDYHDTQFCPDYCCFAVDSRYLQCCDDVNKRVPESKRDQECITDDYKTYDAINDVTDVETTWIQNYL